jgi:hypothetical protein
MGAWLIRTCPVCATTHYAQPETPQQCPACGAVTDGYALRGVLYAALFSAPLWALIIWAIYRWL